MSKNNNNKRY